MQPRKYVKWTPRLRTWIIKQWQAGITPIAEIARNRSVPRRSMYMLIARFKRFGWNGLEPRKKGRKKDKINAHFEMYVLQLWATLPRGNHKMWLDLKNQGFGVSERKIQQIYCGVREAGGSEWNKHSIGGAK